MANDFSADVNCKALWNLESGAVPFLADSKGSNTLINSGMSEDTSDYKQGSCSALFETGVGDDAFVYDADLDAGFPYKNGDTNKKISMCFWIKPTGSGENRIPMNKGSSSDKTIRIELTTSDVIRLCLSTDGGSWTNYAHGTALTSGRWYHVAVTYEYVGANGNYRIRIWDDTAHAIVGVDATGSDAIDTHVDAASFFLGYPSATYDLNSRLDEFVVFNDILSVDEIDQIRGGTYGGGAPPTTKSKFGNLISDEVIDQKIGMFAKI